MSKGTPTPDLHRLRAKARQMKADERLGPTAIAKRMGLGRRLVKDWLTEDRHEGLRIHDRRDSYRPRRPAATERIVHRADGAPVDTGPAQVPDDTRSLTARILGDPLPGRSALDREAASTARRGE